ncbi:MAG: PIG-L family deacetylase, partial [bacterium]|nr:PIG-L family deacetylase [bacterium]
SKVSIEKIKPTIVVFPSSISYNQDHRIVAEAIHASLRPSLQNSKHKLKTVLIYEEPSDSWTLQKGFEPDFFVVLTNNQLNTKITALKLYKSQLRATPNLRSPEILKVFAKARGALCGCKYAEGYRNLRIIY